MTPINFYNHHYILTDHNGLITDAWSDGPHPDRDTTGAICINEEGGYQFRLLVKREENGKYLHTRTEENPPLYTMDGIPLYRWDGEEAILRSEEEIEADRVGKDQSLLPSVMDYAGPSEADMQAFVMLQAQDLPEVMALSMPTLYKPWEAGKHYGGSGEEKIVSFQQGTGGLSSPQLYKCVMPHQSQEGWEPCFTPTLWTAINESNAGSLSDPIPAVRSMEYTYGLYYSDPEDGKVYKCERIGATEGDTITLHYLPHELIGNYFTLAE